MKTITQKYYEKPIPRVNLNQTSYKTLLFAEKFLDLANLFFAGYVVTLLLYENISLMKVFVGLCICSSIYLCINIMLKWSTYGKRKIFIWTNCYPEWSELFNCSRYDVCNAMLGYVHNVSGQPKEIN